MGKFGRIALLLLGSLAALVAIILIGVNLYVQSQGTQARIQQELSQRLNTALHVQRVSVTPWGGLTLTGITIPQTSNASASEFLEAKSFHLHVRFFSLFSPRLVIRKVVLLNPTVVWPQDADGKWRLPGAAPESPPTIAPANAPAESTPPAESQPLASATQGPAQAPVEARTEKTERPPVPEIRRVAVKDGSFKFLDRAGNVVARFDGVDFRSSVRNDFSLRGNTTVARISLRDRFFLADLQSPLRYDPNELDLWKISAHAADGEVSGRFTMQPQTEDSPFNVSVRFRNVQADQIVADAGGSKGVVQGRLEGSFDAAGKTADPNALSGNGEIFLRDGQLRQYTLLVALGQVLQIQELTQLHLEQAQAKYRVTPGLVTIDELILRSPNIRVSCSGTVTFKGKLKLNAQLAINDKIRDQLFKPIRENFQPVDEPGYAAVDFHVSGSIDRPKSDLVEKVMGGNLKDFVSGFLGGGKSGRGKKQKSGRGSSDELESPSPTPTPAVDAKSPAATPVLSPP